MTEKEYAHQNWINYRRNSQNAVGRICGRFFGLICGICTARLLMPKSACSGAESSSGLSTETIRNLLCTLSGSKYIEPSGAGRIIPDTKTSPEGISPEALLFASD